MLAHPSVTHVLDPRGNGHTRVQRLGWTTLGVPEYARAWIRPKSFFQYRKIGLTVCEIRIEIHKQSSDAFAASL